MGTTDVGSYKLKISHGTYGLDLDNASSLTDWEIYSAPGGNLALYSDNTTYVGAFDKVSGAYTPISDERLKTNIKPMTTMLDKIMQLKPPTYEFKNNKNSRQYNGFIAQDVSKTFPSMIVHNVDKERNLDVYTMDYNGLGVIAIKGIQELNVIIEEQRKQNENLQNQINDLKALVQTITKQVGVSSTSSAAFIKQSMPNPANSNIIISYYVPADTRNAKILKSNMNGSVLITYSLTNGEGQITIRGSELMAGTYNYTLYVNDRKTDTKKMIIM